jgi:hypothetical protein
MAGRRQKGRGRAKPRFFGKIGSILAIRQSPLKVRWSKHGLDGPKSWERFSNLALTQSRKSKPSPEF